MIFAGPGQNITVTKQELSYVKNHIKDSMVSLQLQEKRPILHSPIPKDNSIAFF